MYGIPTCQTEHNQEQSTVGCKTNTPYLLLVKIRLQSVHSVHVFHHVTNFGLHLLSNGNKRGPSTQWSPSFGHRRHQSAVFLQNITTFFQSWEPPWRPSTFQSLSPTLYLLQTHRQLEQQYTCPFVKVTAWVACACM